MPPSGLVRRGTVPHASGADGGICLHTLVWENVEMKTMRALWNDEAGVVISAELVLVLTITVLAMVVGLSEVAVAVNTELNDLSNAFGALDQSYSFTGFHACDNWKLKSQVAGSRFTDTHDDCDKNTSCDLVCGPPSSDTCG
jgi:Flp pilus assembly pilin Flp